MVESTALEMRRACKGAVGSNPTLSATSEQIWARRPPWLRRWRWRAAAAVPIATPMMRTSRSATSTRCASARRWSRRNRPSGPRSFRRAAVANAVRVAGVISGPILSASVAARSASASAWLLIARSSAMRCFNDPSPRSATPLSIAYAALDRLVEPLEAAVRLRGSLWHLGRVRPLARRPILAPIEQHPQQLFEALGLAAPAPPRWMTSAL